MDLLLDSSFPFSDVSKTLQRINMYPYFDLTHYILMCLLVKEDTPQLGSPVFSRKHPFASWLASMLMCFAGTIIGNALTGEALIAPFKNHPDIMLASAVWYIMNYSPFDLAYKVAKFAPIHLVVCLLKEVQRARKVYDGVLSGVRLYPQAYLLNVLIGLVKGNGSPAMLLFARIVMGQFQPTLVGSFSVTTKACLVAATAFLLEHNGVLPPQYHNHIFLGVVAFFVLLKLGAKLVGLGDPFRPMESLACGIFFGGLVDALGRVLRRGGAGVARVATLPAQPVAAEHGGAANGATAAATKVSADKKNE